MDAGQKREELVRTARRLMQTRCVCYSELFECMEEDIRDLAREIKSPTGYVMACIVDDVQDLVDEEEYLTKKLR